MKRFIFLFLCHVCYGSDWMPEPVSKSGRHNYGYAIRLINEFRSQKICQAELEHLTQEQIKKNKFFRLGQFAFIPAFWLGLFSSFEMKQNLSIQGSDYKNKFYIGYPYKGLLVGSWVLGIFVSVYSYVSIIPIPKDRMVELEQEINRFKNCIRDEFVKQDNESLEKGKQKINFTYSASVINS